MSKARRLLDAAVLEDDFKDTILRYAHLRHWMVHHDRPARTKDGWRTAIQGDKGFPDVLLVRGHRMVVAELKSENGRVTAEQEEWLAAFRDVSDAAPHVRAYVWRPSDWPEIEETLR